VTVGFVCQKGKKKKKKKKKREKGGKERDKSKE
jgi:hypothetical protein